MNQKSFEETISKFQKIEDARDQLWDRALLLIKSGFEIEAYILILSTWNFARFRFLMKKFSIVKFIEVIQNIDPIYKKLENLNFEQLDFKDSNLLDDIKFIYTQLKKIAEQTGATKLMALKNSKLFIMWDTEIRKIYKVNDTADADDYVQFLKTMKIHFKDIIWIDRNKPLAKVIDEYNYVIANQIRTERKAKKLRTQIIKK